MRNEERLLSTVHQRKGVNFHLVPLFVILLLVQCLSQTSSFIAPKSPPLFRIHNRHYATTRRTTHSHFNTYSKGPTKTELAAKSKSLSNGSGGGNSSGGMGFGAASRTNSKSQAMQGKVRSVSGFAGSGTKPLRQAANTFDALREEHGTKACWDLYCKSPLDDKYRLWFVGKIAVRPNTSATPQQAVLGQKRIILEYAKRELRPQNLGLPKYADSLELWLAPGDSELDCVQNKISLEKVVGSLADLSNDFSVADVGYNPEIYVGDEREQGGLRIMRDENGHPIKPVFEINQSA